MLWLAIGLGVVWWVGFGLSVGECVAWLNLVVVVWCFVIWGLCE